ncbi:unnamed protein product [Phyllotreta striolata]|uniref:C2 domain-containing protein n=1 Tax=Phyllotreta striolata TaxID=444603 RepID=A0A9N9XP03_PHYSR|nr:unnamed protein product [Phyllotreta striolata]
MYTGCYGLGVIEPALYKSTLDLDEIQWPDGHIGRIWFSLRYEPSTEKLLVSLLKAKNLPSRTIGTVNSCDPFLLPDERRYLQSRQKKKTCNPYFDETLVFQVSAKDMADHTLKLTVIDGGRTKKKSEIGHITFPLKDLEIGDGLEQELFKMDLEKEAPEYKTDLGELLISLVYNENLCRLTATVIEARRLKVSTIYLAPARLPRALEPSLSVPYTSEISPASGHFSRDRLEMAKIESENGRVDVNMNGDAWENVIDIEEESAPKSAEAVVEAARKVFASGKTRPIDFRKDQLKKFLTFLEDEKEGMVKAVHKDLRKHRQESETCEIELVANDLRHTLLELKKWSKPKCPEKRVVNLLDGVYIYNDPYGVVLIIGAWNYPILLSLGPMIGAIAAGNAVILKPSELSPHTAHFLATVLTKYLDKETFQVYLGGIEETTELLEFKFDYIFFTGSTQVGKIIHQAAAKNLTPCTLELGGKSPVFLDESADMEKATKRILWGKLLNSGQTCVAPDYVLCTKATEKVFLQHATKILTEFYGADPRNSTYLSRIVTERHFKRLVEFIKPEHVAVGGKFDAETRVIAPTILVDVDPDDPVLREEIFGPIMPVINVKDHKEAIEFINAREKPLALYVFTKDKEVRNAMLAETSSGGAVVNDTVTHLITENLPFGGVGFSGMGSYHGKHGYDTFSHQKAVLVKDFTGFTELSLSLRYPPYNDAKTAIMNFALKKRRGVPMGLVKNAGIFTAGLTFSYFSHFLWCLIAGCKY